MDQALQDRNVRFRPIADIRLLLQRSEMTDSPDPYCKLPLWQRASPILGALCFGLLMYVTIELGARDRPVFGIGFILLGIGAVVAGRKLTKSYSPPAVGVYIFAGGCIIFGTALIAARA